MSENWSTFSNVYGLSDRSTRSTQVLVVALIDRAILEAESRLKAMRTRHETTSVADRALLGETRLRNRRKAG